jgi:hypothetical protein
VIHVLGRIHGPFRAIVVVSRLGIAVLHDGLYLEQRSHVGFCPPCWHFPEVFSIFGAVLVRFIVVFVLVVIGRQVDSCALVIVSPLMGSQHDSTDVLLLLHLVIGSRFKILLLIVL